MNRYILKDNIPVPEPDLIKWGKWMEKADSVAQDKVGEMLVSTVFLGLDHQFGAGEPVLFETMVFGGEYDGEQDKYSTWEEAEAGHAEILAKVKGVGS